MTENTPSAKPAPPSSFFYAVPLLIVLAVGAMFWAGNDEREADAEEASEKVLEGKDYYVLVTLMEFHPAKQGGAGWDAGSSAPDMYYQLNWHGKTVYHTENDVVKNALIAKWFGLGANVSVIELRKVLTSDGQRLSPRNLIKAALISVEPNGELVISAYDDDPLRDDFAGGCTIPLADLEPGDNAYFIDAEGKPTRDRDRMAADRGGVKRFVLRVVDSEQPVEKLVEALR
ncbi:MAG: hypothetical protein OSB74_12390 [Verrucomicrobiota bacterium]|jgi:hypothetical protein|nr:hypothetical protein [Verrucomicrobiota bacterium]